MGTFFEQNSYYVVLGVILILWCAIFIYMINVEKRVKKLEKK